MIGDEWDNNECKRGIVMTPVATITGRSARLLASLHSSLFIRLIPNHPPHPHFDLTTLPLKRNRASSKSRRTSSQNQRPPWRCSTSLVAWR